MELSKSDAKLPLFFYLIYKDAPELSQMSKRNAEIDLSVEKTLLINPNCPIRIILEYIRKKCKLGSYCSFDLCDDSGALKGLFNLPAYTYGSKMFENRGRYYIIVMKTESDKRLSVLPQLCWDNPRYDELKSNVKRFLLTGSSRAVKTPTSSKSSTSPKKGSSKKKPPKKGK